MNYIQSIEYVWNYNHYSYIKTILKQLTVTYNEWWNDKDAVSKSLIGWANVTNFIPFNKLIITYLCVHILQYMVWLQNYVQFNLNKNTKCVFKEYTN